MSENLQGLLENLHSQKNRKARIEEARTLYNKGLLPSKWNDKKVKKNRLDDLIDDPNFIKHIDAAKNKYQDGGIAYDNLEKLRRLKEAQELRRIPSQTDPVATPEAEGTDFSYLQRQLMEEKLRKLEREAGMPDNYQDGGLVNSYKQLQNMRNQQAIQEAQQGLMTREDGKQPQQFANGGIPFGDPMADPMQPMGYMPEEEEEEIQEPEMVAPMAPAPVAPQSDYEKLLAEYEAQKEQYGKDKNKAVIGDALSQALDAFTKYGVQKGTGEAMAASGLQLKTPKVASGTTDLVKGLKAPSLDDLVKKAKLKKELEAKKKAPISKTVDGRLYQYDPNNDKWDLKIDEKSKTPVSKTVDGKLYQYDPKSDKWELKVGESLYSLDPNDPLNKAMRDEFRTYGVNVPDDFVGSKKLERTLDRIRKTRQANERIDEKRLNRELRESDQQIRRVEGLSKRLEKSAIPTMARAMNDIDTFLKNTYDFDLGKYKSGNKIKELDIEGTGFFGQYKPDAMLDQKSLDFRQNVQTLANELLKSRSGAAVSDQEYRRLLMELGKGNFSNTRDVISGIAKMNKDLRNKTKIIEASDPETIKFYKEYGGVLPSEILGIKSKSKPKGEAPYGETVERNGKTWKWNPIKGKYQILTQ